MIRYLLRGGSYDFDTGDLRTTYRGWFLPVLRDWDFGFRLVIRREA